MIFVRTEELLGCVDLVADGVNVEIVGAEGSGRSTLLGRLVESLERRGYDVLRVTGIQPLRSIPLEALDIAGLTVDPNKGEASLGRTASTIAERVVSQPTVIVIDDAAFVDDESWGVIAAVHARTRVPLVTTARLGSPNAHESSLRSIVGHAIEVRLAPLSFDAVSDILHDRLGHAIDASVVSRILTKSAGLPSLVVAMADAASHAGQLSLAKDTWRATADLWNAGMNGVVEHLLRDLSPSSRDSIEVIALVGPIDLETASDLVGYEELELLESMALLSIVGSLGRTMVAVTPPIVVEYFRHRPTTVRRLRHLRRVRDTLGETEEADSSARNGAASADDWDPADPAFLRLIHDRRAAQLPSRRYAWEADPRAASAIAYLEVLFQDSRAEKEIDAVFEATQADAGDERAQTLFLLYKMRWLALQRGNLAAAREIADSLPDSLQNYNALVQSWALQLEVYVDGVPEDIDERFSRLSKADQQMWSSTYAARAFALIVKGKCVSALAMLDRVEEEPAAPLPRSAALLRSWALFGSGDILGALEWATIRRDECRAQLDVDGLRAQTYVAALALVSLGRYRSAENALGTILALGDTSVGQERTHMAVLAMASVLAAREGRIPVAESLSRQVLELGVQSGPFPGMAADLPRAVLLALAGNVEAATDTLNAQVEQQRDQGYSFAAAITRLYSYDYLAQPLSDDSTTRLSTEFEGTLIGPLAEFNRALRKEDPAELERLGSWFRSEERLGTASQAFAAARRFYESAGDTAKATAMGDLVEEVSTLRDPFDVRVSHWRAGAQVRLSSREREVAMLAGDGLTNVEIASRLNLSARTVESHMLQINRKLGVRTRADLAGIPWQ